MCYLSRKFSNAPSMVIFSIRFIVCVGPTRRPNWGFLQGVTLAPGSRGGGITAPTVLHPAHGAGVGHFRTSESIKFAIFKFLINNYDFFLHRRSKNLGNLKIEYLKGLKIVVSYIFDNRTIVLDSIFKPLIKKILYKYIFLSLYVIKLRKKNIIGIRYWIVVFKTTSLMNLLLKFIGSTKFTNINVKFVNIYT